MSKLNNNTFNPDEIRMVTLSLQNSQVDLILRAIELYGYNLKYMVNDSKIKDEERSIKEAKLQYTYQQIRASQAEQVNSKVDADVHNTPVTQSMNSNKIIDIIPINKAIS